MNASILIVGGDDFLAAPLVEQIRSLSACTIKVVPSPKEAEHEIQAQQPDLLILQASQEGSLDLCRQLKEQTRLAWIYCIVLDDRQPWDTSLSTYQWQAGVTAEALENGADAHLWLFPQLVSPLAEQEQSGLESDLKVHSRLLQAQIRVGLRVIKNHHELMRTNNLLSTIALSDPLTELNNRRALEWELPRQIQNARSRPIPLSLIMMDVDYFKSINDRYGHLVGDRALKLIAGRLRHNLRYYDTPFRYGGEEFVIILSNTDSLEAPKVAERLCRLISDQPFVIEGTPDLRITVSAGIASLRPEDDPKGISLLRRADQNLLRAKAEGRNRIVTCDGVFFGVLESIEKKK